MDNADEVPGQMARIVATHTKTVSMLGARSMVLGAFFDAALPHLASAQRAEVTRSFRQRIEEALRRWTICRCPSNITRRCLNSPIASSTPWVRNQVGVDSRTRKTTFLVEVS
jgi:hypothetical protein